MTTVSVDRAALGAAIPDVEALIRTLDGAARTIDGLDVPGGVGARLAAVRQDLARAARRLDPVPDDLRTRTVLAADADAPWVTAFTVSATAGKWFADSFGIGALSRTAATAW